MPFTGAEARPNTSVISSELLQVWVEAMLARCGDQAGGGRHQSSRKRSTIASLIAWRIQIAIKQKWSFTYPVQLPRNLYEPEHTEKVIISSNRSLLCWMRVNIADGFILAVETKRLGMKQCLPLVKDMWGNHGHGGVYGFISTVMRRRGVLHDEKCNRVMEEEKELWWANYVYTALQKIAPELVANDC